MKQAIASLKLISLLLGAGSLGAAVKHVGHAGPPPSQAASHACGAIESGGCELPVCPSESPSASSLLSTTPTVPETEATRP